MAKTTAPLLSFGADGQVAKSIVYSKWRGIPYVRRHVVPANPNTTAQQLTRTTFALLREQWKVAPAGLVLPWDTFATGRPFTGMNKYVGENLRVLRGQADFANYIGSPGARGGLPASSTSIVPGVGSGEIDVTAVAPAPPSGWTLDELQAVAFPDQSPSGIFQDAITYGSAADPAVGIGFTGLTPNTAYCVSAWLQWTKPDASLAFGVSTTAIVTSTP